MRKGASLLSRVALVGAATVVAVAMGSPAWAANATIDINPGPLPTTASGFTGEHKCDPNQGGGPYATLDVWVFNLPEQGDNELGEFVSVTATFGANGDITITTALNPGNFNTGGPGTSKAWIYAPAGWTLTDAEAVISDPEGNATSDTFFVLTHTCPADPQSSTPPPTTGPPSETTGPPRTTDPGTPSGGVSSGGGGSQSNAGLVWGVTALVVAGAGGAVLFLAWRRRNSA